MTPRQLLRLYPRLWRRRYGVEFEAMLEGTTIDRRVIRDVIRAAAFEWTFNSYVGRVVIGLMITTIASGAALYLRDHVASPPMIETFPGGSRLVTPPWPTGLAVWGSGLYLLFVIRSFVGIVPRARIRHTEFVGWCLLLLGASTVQQWSSLIFNLGTGIEAWSITDIWETHALMNCVGLANSWVFSILANSKYVAHGRQTTGPPVLPLGLSHR